MSEGRAAPTPYREPTDHYGRTLYGNHVHQDFYPFRWLPWFLALTVLVWLDFVPSIVKIVAILAFAAKLIHTLVILIPRDTVPLHLKTK